MTAIFAITWILIIMFFLIMLGYIKQALDEHANMPAIFGILALSALAGGLVLYFDPPLREHWDIVLLIAGAVSVLFLNVILDAPVRHQYRGAGKVQ